MMALLVFRTTVSPRCRSSWSMQGARDTRRCSPAWPVKISASATPSASVAHMRMNTPWLSGGVLSASSSSFMLARAVLACPSISSRLASSAMYCCWFMSSPHVRREGPVAGGEVVCAAEGTGGRADLVCVLPGVLAVRDHHRVNLDLFLLVVVEDTEVVTCMLKLGVVIPRLVHGSP